MEKKLYCKKYNNINYKKNIIIILLKVILYVNYYYIFIHEYKYN